MRMRGRSAVVTGGGNGIGAATARLMASEGAAVAVVDIDPDRAEHVAASIRSEGGRAVAVIGDVTDPDQVRSIFELATEHHGTPDALFSNAGVGGPMGSIVDTALDEFDRCMAVNVRGVWLTVAECIRGLQGSSKPGTIVITASVDAVFAESGCPAYVASKGAVTALTRALALDHTHEGIRINAVCPGYTATDMTVPFLEETEGRLDAARTRALGRLANPEEIANVVLFLSSPDSSFMVGACVLADGGLSIGAVPPWLSAG